MVPSGFNSVDTIKLWFSNFIDEDKIPDCLRYLVAALQYFDDFEYQSFIGNALQALCGVLGFWTCYEAVVPDLNLNVMDLAGTEKTFYKFDDVVKYFTEKHPIQK